MHYIQQVKHARRASKDPFGSNKTIKIFCNKSLFHFAIILFAFVNLITTVSAKENDGVQEGVAADAATLLKLGTTTNNRQYLRRGQSGRDVKVRKHIFFHRY